MRKRRLPTNEEIDRFLNACERRGAVMAKKLEGERFNVLRFKVLREKKVRLDREVRNVPRIRIPKKEAWVEAIESQPGGWKAWLDRIEQSRRDGGL